MKLADVRLLVENVGRSVAFYRDVVGLEPRIEVLEGVYAELRLGEMTLGLYLRELMQQVIGGGQSIGSAGSVVLIFDVDDVDTEYQRLMAAGADGVTQPHDKADWGLRVCHFRDPDGHLIELNHPITTE